jgi:DGQHR domain-containing protein
MSPAKVKAIRRFLEQDKRNTIPTSVILTLDLPEGSVESVEGYESFAILNFEVLEGQQKPGLIIDGQHRLLGMNDFSPTTNVNVVAILGANDVEKAFQFLVINNKASKVSLDHIRALALHYEDEALKTRLTTARLTLNPNVPFVGLVNDGDDSPFRGMISWPLTPEKDRVVLPAAIEGAISLIQQTKVREFESDDVLLEFFYTIWRRIRQAWPQIWRPDSRLLSKVGIICMTQYMTDSLVSSYDLELLDISDPDAVGKKVESILQNQVEAFWVTPWTSTSYDTKVGRSMIVDALVQIARNVRSGVAWYEDIGLVDPANVEEIGTA